MAFLNYFWDTLLWDLKREMGTLAQPGQASGKLNTLIKNWQNCRNISIFSIHVLCTVLQTLLSSWEYEYCNFRKTFPICIDFLHCFISNENSKITFLDWIFFAAVWLSEQESTKFLYLFWTESSISYNSVIWIWMVWKLRVFIFIEELFRRENV